MAKSKSVAKQFAEFEEDVFNGMFIAFVNYGLGSDIFADFDPEEAAPEQNSDDSASGSSEDDLAGTEHYAKVR